MALVSIVKDHGRLMWPELLVAYVLVGALNSSRLTLAQAWTLAALELAMMGAVMAALPLGVVWAWKVVVK